jgi:polyisoprenoid-binding protein YceI
MIGLSPAAGPCRMTLRAILVLLLLLPLSSDAQPGGQLHFVIDNERSWLRVLVYRAGLMSALGHNHVIASHDISGTVAYSDQLTDTVVEMFVTVETLVVDDAELRVLEGEDFAGRISEKDIKGTRKNMLGHKLLDAANHPIIRVKSTDIRGKLDSLTVIADVTIAGRTSPIKFSANASLSGNQVTVSGDTRISHEDLGLKPFSAAFGTLKVRQDMLVRFEITAALATATE